ncbi:radial spoke head protein 3 homolog [Bacillus rossius redtenbacheri]|uniref:radial spoke head protein 3 homolog n=1 Tax=Bacillus rossius redtenbacheri TaxID=93214 RepID=UPI002FDEFC68
MHLRTSKSWCSGAGGRLARLPPPPPPPPRVVPGGAFVGFDPAGGGEGESRAARDRAARRQRIEEDLARRLDFQKRRFRLMHPMLPAKGRPPAETERAATCLEEITGRPLEGPVEQWELFAYRPPSPEFAPAYIAVDASTQVEPGDLYDYDVEAAPLLALLAGSAALRAMDEVVWEEEQDGERRRRSAWCQACCRERGEAQRLQEQERRLAEEAQRRVGQYPAALEAAAAREAAAAEATVSRGAVSRADPPGFEPPGCRDTDPPWELAPGGLDGEILEDVVRQVVDERRRGYVQPAPPQAHDPAAPKSSACRL